MLLGSRVVRGPDFKSKGVFDNSCEVGTIVDLHNYQDGSPLPKETVLVYWDSGDDGCYRAGQDGYYDLRVFDSAPAGIKFDNFTCVGCNQSGIAGMRWHCTDCPDYDLCSVCYMNDVHDKKHSFERFDIPNDEYYGVEVGKRSTSLKIQSKGIFPGAKVRTRKDLKSTWTSPVLIGGEVVELSTWKNTPRCVVRVKWGDISEQLLRVGYEGKVDLEVVRSASGPQFYQNHLPVVSVDGHIRLINRIAGYEKNITDKEIKKEGENAIEYLDKLLNIGNKKDNAVLCRIKKEIQNFQHDVDLRLERKKKASQFMTLLPPEANEEVPDDSGLDESNNQPHQKPDDRFEKDDASINEPTDLDVCMEISRVRSLISKYEGKPYYPKTHSSALPSYPQQYRQGGELGKNDQEECEGSKVKSIKYYPKSHSSALPSYPQQYRQGSELGKNDQEECEGSKVKSIKYYPKNHSSALPSYPQKYRQRSELGKKDQEECEGSKVKSSISSVIGKFERMSESSFNKANMEAKLEQRKEGKTSTKDKELNICESFDGKPSKYVERVALKFGGQHI